MMDVAELDAAVEEARREALDLIARLAGALAVSLDALEMLMGSEGGSPVEWPLSDELVLERVQLKAFVETMKKLPAATQQLVRGAYAPELKIAKASSGFVAMAELRSSPVLPETKAAAAEMIGVVEEVRRAALFDRDLTMAARPLLGPHRWPSMEPSSQV